MAGQGSTGNVIAAMTASRSAAMSTSRCCRTARFFIPGLGQLIQGRPMRAVVMFVLAAILWWFLLGWVIHLWSILDAALWKPRGVTV